MKVLRAVHTTYGVIVFSILFLFFFFLLLIPIFFPSQFRFVGIFNRWWARLLFFLIGIRYTIKYRSALDPTAQYIFCPNHFSYLDIPAMGLNHHNAIFVGKSSMQKIPFFGFMYSKLHITVDRNKLKSRYSTMMRAFQALDEGKSLVIFPEGGIVTEHDPFMGTFKNGAFRASIEKQIPIVPVTIPYNWIILPVDEFLLTWRPMELIFHEPMDPAAYTMKDIERYKQDVRVIIEKELKKFSKE
ncbi:MAG TPA: lysophospholipid acyltransferase family protein [Chryseosolibacter sp.]|nr:lysophospholipid acyltransferase family protein [Chryseosolibacter sp.]